MRKRMRDRFFIEGTHTVGERVRLPADDARKIATVLRKQTGARIRIVDSAGVAFAATLDVAGKAVHATLDEMLERAQIEGAARIVIAQAIPKGQKMDFIVEKATELGASAIVPLRSSRVVGERTGDHKIERWQRIAKAAAQQSGRLQIPAIAPIADWDSLIATFKEYDRVYIPWELAAAAPLRDRFEAEARTAESILVIVGPEGGFSHDEVARAQAAGASAISLGMRILRTETAALVVLAALLYARGEL
ncbi:MAG: 16S rRNA (uracil(1498)-N(3))-methyltransferase [Candidatus Velthaea sp.]